VRISSLLNVDTLNRKSPISTTSMIAESMRRWGTVSWNTPISLSTYMPAKGKTNRDPSCCALRTSLTLADMITLSSTEAIAEPLPFLPIPLSDHIPIRVRRWVKWNTSVRAMSIAAIRESISGMISTRTA